MKSIKNLVAIIATTSLVSIAVLANAGESSSAAARDVDSSHHGVKGDAANGDKKSWRKHAPNGREHIPFKILDLTDAQKKSLESTRAAQEASRQALHEKTRNAHDALRKAGDANADDATLTKLSSELASLIAQQEVTRVKDRRQFLSLLTAEQKQKLDAFEAEHKNGRRGDGPRGKEKRQG